MHSPVTKNYYQKDGPFLADDYPDNEKRTFRGSLYAPMTGHLSFVVNQCGGKHIKCLTVAKCRNGDMTSRLTDRTYKALKLRYARAFQ